MFALLFPESGHGAAQTVLPCSKTQKDRAANVEAKENRRMRALNKAVIRRWYSVASASVTRSGCENAYPSRKPCFTGSATREPHGGCYGQLNRHDKRIASLARIQSRFHATLYSFTERMRRISTGSLQPLQYAIRWVENPNAKEKQRFLASGAAYNLAHRNSFPASPRRITQPARRATQP